MGSYGGGNGILLEASSTGFTVSKDLSVPSTPDMVSKYCGEHTWPMPYWVCSINDATNPSARNELEDRCLAQIQKQLWIAKSIGKRIKALMLELILGGSGGELSDRFLEKLGDALKHYQVAVIVDECLTGGRVGPGMAMTNNTPPSFQECVQFITFSKFPTCGLLIQRVPNRPTTDQARGTSTDIEAGSACQLFKQVEEQLRLGTHEACRANVVAKMKLKAEEVWGRGGLVFGTLARPHVVKGTKCRYLPRLDKSKIEVGRTERTDWTRTTICKTLQITCERWLSYLDEMNQELYPMLVPIYACYCATNSSFLTPQMVLDYLGEEKAFLLACKLRLRVTQGKTALARTCMKQPKTFVRESLDIVVKNYPSAMTKARKGGKRQYRYLILSKSFK